jgi:predicted DNA-binding transcriptional regulator AlpA
MARQADTPELLLMPEVAEITRMNVDTLRWLRHRGESPPSFRLGRRVVYPAAGLKEWIKAQADRTGRGDAA